MYLFAGPPQLGRRIWQLAAGGAAMLVSAGWWIAIVQLWPASSRPYIGGSQNNSLWNLMFGYNGFGRLTGNETGSVGGGAQGTASRWGPTGLTRLFNGEFGGQASWLLPAALIVLGAGLVFTWRMPRTDRTRAALLLWGGWLFVTGAAFSLGQGIIHPYYTVALAPPIGALVGIGATRLWHGRRHPAARVVLAVAFAATVGWSYVLLGRTPLWHPALRSLVLVGGIVVTALLVVSAMPWLRRFAAAIAAAALLVALAGPAAYTLSTVAPRMTVRSRLRARRSRVRVVPAVAAHATLRAAVGCAAVSSSSAMAARHRSPTAGPRSATARSAMARHAATPAVPAARAVCSTARHRRLR